MRALAHFATGTALIAGILGGATGAYAATPSSAPTAKGDVNNLLAQGGKDTTFVRDTVWKITPPAGLHIVSGPNGGFEYANSAGKPVMKFTPQDVIDTAGTTHKVTWSVKGQTVHQHVDIKGGSVKGHLAPAVEARGFWGWVNCVGKASKGYAVGGAVGGCVADLETGCAPGAVTGAGVGAIAGAASGLSTC